MKTLLMVILLLVPVSVLAQNYQGMNEQEMMQRIQKMQTCMQDVDQKKLQELEERAQVVEAQLQALCDEGKRHEAQAKALAFDKEFNSDPNLQTVKKCTKLMEGMGPGSTFINQDTEEEDGHVCD
jgi:hypothetical protein